MDTTLALAVEAFDDDPFYRWLLPRRRRARLEAVMRLALRRSVVRAEPGGLIAWHAPDARRVGPSLLDLGPALRLLVALGAWRRLVIGARLMRALARARPSGPHVHLELFAVARAERGRGLGKRLLGDLLAHADARGWPVALDTTNPDNLPLYRRFGFEVTREVRVADAPPAWVMLRPAPTTRGAPT
ncbi:MAG: GNAT family N-acetyltransferase [Deltaproteobacteria bacterium]|nr:GNAT family N-acetyltransferase [Deltaproteobacteria bacterium]